MFFTNVKMVRLKKRLSQKELAAKANMTPPSLSKIEKYNANQKNTFVAVAIALDECPLSLIVCNCDNCRNKKTYEERLKCRQSMIDKGYNPYQLNLTKRE